MHFHLSWFQRSVGFVSHCLHWFRMSGLSGSYRLPHPAFCGRLKHSSMKDITPNPWDCECALFGKKAFAYGIEFTILRWVHLRWLGGGCPKYNEKCPYKRMAKGNMRQRIEDTDRRGNMAWRQIQRLERYGHIPWNVAAIRSWRKQGKILPWRLAKSGTLQHLDFTLLTSRTVKEEELVVLRHQVCGISLW